MAQLRQDYDKFAENGAEIVVVGPDTEKVFAHHWEKERYPFIGLPDPDLRVLNLYGQEVKLLKLGRLPAQMLIDKQGTIRFAHYGDSMQDIRPNDALLDVIRAL